MMAKRQKEKRSKTKSGAALRASVSFPRELYRSLEDVAKRKKVSLAWVVREATEHYIAEAWPLFRGQK